MLFDALSVIKFKTMLEIWWTCSWGYQRNTDGSWFGEVMGSPVISWWFQRWDEHLEMTMAPTLIFILDCVATGHMTFLWRAEDLLISKAALVNLSPPWRVNDISGSVQYSELQKETEEYLNPIHNGKMQSQVSDWKKNLFDNNYQLGKNISKCSNIHYFKWYGKMATLLYCMF